MSANAGSGKTHVLTQRVIRLLLAGCRPSAILCLTYTKAAASEMSNRVFERLAEWVTLDDEALDGTDRRDRGRASRICLKLAEARRLFARALETPGGLKIQTIHAFCEALLHQFPLEANVAGHFSVLDDRAAATLARRCAPGAADGDAPAKTIRSLPKPLPTCSISPTTTGLEKLLSAISSPTATPSSRFTRWMPSGKGGIDAALLRPASVLLPMKRADAIAGQFWPLPGLTGATLELYLGLPLSTGGAKVAGDRRWPARVAKREADPIATRRDPRKGLLTAKRQTEGGFSRSSSRRCATRHRTWTTLVAAARDHMSSPAATGSS